MDLATLRERTPHQLKPVFDRYDRVKIADQLEITAGHLSNILVGTILPGRKLARRMEVLAGRIIQAEKLV